MQQGQTVSISAIAGMGGIGKTELAWQYADRQGTAGTYSGGICWLRGREDLAVQIVLFARSHLHLTIPEDLELAKQVAQCWGQWGEQETLLVFDDVQDYRDVEKVLPPARSQFKILLTTRSRLGSPVRNFGIKVLDEASALELLRAIVQDERIDRDLATAKQVCEWLGYLPLGLELVGRYLVRKKDVSLTKLWQRLQDKKLAAKALLDAEPGMTASLGVTAAFELSWQELDQDAQRLAAFLSLFAPAEIPWRLVEAALHNWDTEELEDLRDEKLLGLNLLQRAGEGQYELHQLLREFFAVKRSYVLDLEAAQQSVYSVVIDETDRAINKPERSLREETNVILPHLAEVIERFETAGDEEALALCLGWFAELYRSQGRYDEAEPLYLQALEIYQRQLGADHPDVAMSLNNLAGLYYSQGRYDEAEPLYLQALEICQRQLGADHPDVASSLNNLALLYESQGRYAEAKPLYLQALEICQRQLGADHPDVASSLNNLALLYESQGRYAEAKPLYLRSLTILFEKLGADHPNTQTVWQSFLSFLQQVIQENRIAELSDDPMTRSLLQQLQNLTD